jgi:hypothetical protein
MAIHTGLHSHRQHLPHLIHLPHLSMTRLANQHRVMLGVAEMNELGQLI